MSKRYGYFVFTLLFLLYMFDYASRMVVVSLFPFFKEAYGWSDAQCGLLVSVVYWSIILFTFPASILIDRWSRRKAIGVMAVAWTLATGVCGFAQNFMHLLIARTFVGVGEAGYAPGGTAMISALFPEEKRSSMVGLWSASIPLGSALGIAMGGIIADHFGWRAAFWFVAAPGLLVSLLFFAVKDYRTVELVRNEPKADGQMAAVKMEFWDIVKEFARTKSLVLTYVGFAGMTFVTTSMITWLPTLFQRMSDVPMDMSDASVKASIVMLLAIIGAPAGGILADRWMKRRKNARPLFAGFAALGTAVLLFVALTLTEGTLQYVMFLFTGAVAVSFLPAAAAVTQDVIHPGLRAISYAVCVVVQNLLGSSTGPLYIGAVSDKITKALTPQFGEAVAAKMALTKAMATLPIFALIAAGLFFAAAIFYTKDHENVEHVEIEFED